MERTFFVEVILWLRHPHISHENFDPKKLVNLILLIELFSEVRFVRLPTEFFAQTLVELGANSSNNFFGKQAFKNILRLFDLIFLEEVIVVLREGRGFRLAELGI